MAVANSITAVVNFIALLCSFPVIGAGIWLASKQDNECFSLVSWPVIILGIFILLVSLAGFVGAVWNQQCLLVVYLFSMAVLIILLFVLIVFAFAATRPDGSYDVAGRGYKEYRLAGFSPWLRHYLGNPGNWAPIGTCLRVSNVCGRLGQENLTPDQFFQAHLTPIQSGCCKPPTACGYGYVNPTLWINPANPGVDADCYAWNNDQSQLCYGCTSCKAGLLGSLRSEWRKANIALIVAAVGLIWVYIIACSAFKNAETEDLFLRYKRGYV